jgi:23S rRNA (adenine-N6)-dimethyltransferase
VSGAGRSARHSSRHEKGRPPGQPSRRDWGWHSLTEEWARRIVLVAQVRANDLVIDLGAGRGALVGPALACGARVVAVELHNGRAQALRHRWLEELTARRLVVVCGDAMSVRLPRQRFVLLANPPYAIGAGIIRHVLSPGSRLERGYVVLPSRVAHRLAAGDAPGAARWERTYRLQVGLRLPRSAFHPPPRVDSVLLTITRR